MLQCRTFQATTNGVVDFQSVLMWAYQGTSGTNTATLVSDGALTLLDAVDAGSNGDAPAFFSPDTSPVAVGSIDITLAGAGSGDFTLWAYLKA
jgi:hypothetical protein